MMPMLLVMGSLHGRRAWWVYGGNHWMIFMYPWGHESVTLCMPSWAGPCLWELRTLELGLEDFHLRLVDQQEA